jgi:hypothetical protein
MYRTAAQFHLEKNGNGSKANISIVAAFESAYFRGFFTRGEKHLGMDAFSDMVLNTTGLTGSAFLECIECAHWAVMTDYACRPMGE